MRKNLLSLSIAAMIGGLGLAGSASAGVSIVVPGVSTATALAPSTSGVGNVLLVPYFSTQNGNATLLSIVNSDTVNGKAVKVRFRGAANSDDVFDFQVYLSPSDVWTANVSQAASGLSMLTTADASCTLPSASTLNTTPFVTNRLPAVSSTFTAAQQASWTREGYVEIFNMADITPSTATTSLFYQIKHINGVPPGCPSQNSTGSAFSNLTTDVTTSYATLGLAAPTTGLFGGATIINTSGALVAWSGNDYALVAINNSIPAVAPGNIVFSPQLSTNAASPMLYTNDPLMVGTAPIVTAANYDLPDLSTPYTGTLTPTQQANATAAAIATLAVNNEYLTTTPIITAATDWTFTMPTRRYAVAMNYAATTPAAVYSVSVTGTVSTASNYFNTTNVAISTSNKLLLCVAAGALNGYGQEEQTVAPSGFVISPGQAAPGLSFCGEASVLSFSAATAQTSVLGATVAANFLTGMPSAAGWASIATPGIGYGLPILGATYEQATGPAVAGKSTNFGISYQHRYQRGGTTALAY